MATNQPAPYPAVPPTQGNGLAVAGMVLGILGLVLCWIPFAGWLLALLGIILGALGWSKANKLGGRGKGMAIAGTVCGIIGLVIGVIFLVLTMVAVKGFDDYVKKGRSTEAQLQLHSIERKIKTFQNEKATLPKSASIMPGPAGSGCASGGKMAPQPQSAWDAAGWAEIGFHIDEPSLYSYEWSNTGTNSGVITASGDLDCDGTISTTRVKINLVQGMVETTYEEATPD